MGCYQQGASRKFKNEVPELGPFFINHNERHGNWLLIQEDADGFEEGGDKGMRNNKSW